MAAYKGGTTLANFSRSVIRKSPGVLDGRVGRQPGCTRR